MNLLFTPISLLKNPTDMKDMISFLQLCVLLFASAFFVSCAPFPPDSPINGPVPNAEEVANPEQAAALFEIEKQKAANRKRLAANKERAELEASGRTTTVPKKEVTPPNPKSKYPTATRTREGFVRNPYTGVEVDVRGIPGGSLVRDPDDPNKAMNKFRVP
ncbi:hypothetical protein N9F50_01790 [Akkermansiaceae bacterium]|nr:hypothetical protein [Akkermansiaceae bacterium]